MTEVLQMYAKFIKLKSLVISFSKLEGFYMRPEMKFQPTINKIVFTLLFIVGKMK